MYFFDYSIIWFPPEWFCMAVQAPPTHSCNSAICCYVVLLLGCMPSVSAHISATVHAHISTTVHAHINIVHVVCPSHTHMHTPASAEEALNIFDHILVLATRGQQEKRAISSVGFRCLLLSWGSSTHNKVFLLLVHNQHSISFVELLGS